MKDIPTYNVKIDKDEYSDDGIFTISIVDRPAIKSNFIHMSEEEEQSLYKLASEEKQEVVGAVLIPNKPIYRKDEEGREFYINFTEEAIEDLVYKMSKDGFFNYFNVNHSNGTDGVFMLEYWIKEDEQDKSNKYGFQDLPIGTLFMKAKIEDEMVWSSIKKGELNGFSIEAKTKLTPYKLQEVELQSYSDYPKAAKENAQRALKWAEENGWGSCGTSVGKARANQLASGEPLSEDVIGRMASFARHEQNKDTPYGEGCGGLMWDAWGGDEGIAWAKRKMDEIKSTKMQEQLKMEETKEMLKSMIKEVMTEMGYSEKEDKMQEEGGMSAEGLLMAINDMINDFMSYQDGMSMSSQESKESETKLEENDQTGEEIAKEVGGEASTELSEAEESKSEEVELNEDSAEDKKEEAVELESKEEPKEDSKDEEVELSEEEAEKVLLSEQTESNEDSAEESKPVYLERSNPNFARKFDSWVANLYQNN